jgi:hypothetical protein
MQDRCDDAQDFHAHTGEASLLLLLNVKETLTVLDQHQPRLLYFLITFCGFWL